MSENRHCDNVYPKVKQVADALDSSKPDEVSRALSKWQREMSVTDFNELLEKITEDPRNNDSRGLPLVVFFGDVRSTEKGQWEIQKPRVASYLDRAHDSM